MIVLSWWSHAWTDNGSIPYNLTLGTTPALACDMFKAIVTASVSVLLLTLASAASAKSSCEETADTNYAIAVAIDYENADMVHENAMADCEGEYMSDAEFRVFMLDKIENSGTSAANKRDQLDSFAFTSLCPNGFYDRVNDRDMCEPGVEYMPVIPYTVESLDDTIAIDGEAWLPACQFEGGCVAR